MIRLTPSIINRPYRYLLDGSVEITSHRRLPRPSHSLAESRRPAPQAGQAAIDNPAFDPVPSPGADTSEHVYFEATGHTLQGKFYDYWKSHGGLWLFGYPLSEEYQEVSATDGKPYTVQYFERQQFEYHPEFAGTANEVLLGLLGTYMVAGRSGGAFASSVALPSSPSQVYFEQTGHNLGGSFLSYWNQYGGLPVFGYPLSEEFQEVSATDGKTYTVQYFERARFRMHIPSLPEPQMKCCWAFSVTGTPAASTVRRLCSLA